MVLNTKHNKHFANIGVEQNISKQTAEQATTRKLDNATEVETVEMMPKDKVQRVLALRLAKKLSQKELAQLCNLPLKTIQDIESNKYKKDLALVNIIITRMMK